MGIARILITIPALEREFGGPVVKARRLAEGLGSLGYEVTVAGVGDTPGFTGLPQLFRFHGTPVPRRLGPLRDAVRWADAVHVIGYRDPVGTAAAIRARRLRKPYLLEPAGMHRRRLRSLLLKGTFDRLIGDRVLDAAAAVVATSRLEAGELEADGVPATRIRLRPNGVDVDELLPLPPRGGMRRRLGIPADVSLVLSVGRITAKKGLLELVRAVAALDGAWAVIAGPDSGDGTLDRLLAERARLGLADRLTILPGGLWGPQKAEALADADAFCLPSATENFGNAVAEAAAVGMPVVLSNECGITEWLEPSATSVVARRDPSTLAAALRQMLTAPARAAAEAAAPGLRRVLDWSAVSAQEAAILAGLPKGPGVAPAR